MSAPWTVGRGGERRHQVVVTGGGAAHARRAAPCSRQLAELNRDDVAGRDARRLALPGQQPRLVGGIHGTVSVPELTVTCSMPLPLTVTIAA